MVLRTRWCIDKRIFALFYRTIRVIALQLLRLVNAQKQSKTIGKDADAILEKVAHFKPLDFIKLLSYLLRIIKLKGGETE